MKFLFISTIKSSSRYVSQDWNVSPLLADTLRTPLPYKSNSSNDIGVNDLETDRVSFVSYLETTFFTVTFPE